MRKGHGVSRSLRLVGAALVAVLVLPAPTASAAEAGPSGSANYTCNMTGGGPAAVTVTMTLDSVPESVAPGQTVGLSGSLTFGFTAQTAIGTQVLLARKVGVASAHFVLGAVSGGHTDTIAARSVEAPQASVGNPLKPFSVTAKVALPAYKVPANATGEVALSLPSTANLPNTVAKAPAKVAFTAVLSQNGLLHQRTMACALSKAGAAPLITRIPIVTKTDIAPLGGPALGPGPSAPLPADLPAPASDLPQAAPTSAKTRPVFDAIPPATRHSGVFIPAWSIVVVGLMLPIGALLYAASLRHRLRLMQLAAGGAAADPNRARSPS